MNPLQSTDAKISASPDRAAARAAIVQPYEDDLQFLLEHPDDGKGAAAGGVAPPADRTQQGIVARAIRVVRRALARVPGAAFAQRLPVGFLRH